MRRLDEAKNCIKELENDLISNLLNAKVYKKEGNLNIALKILLENSGNSQFWQEIGLLYWDLGEYKLSFNYFLKVMFHSLQNV